MLFPVERSNIFLVEKDEDMTGRQHGGKSKFELEINAWRSLIFMVLV